MNIANETKDGQVGACDGRFFHGPAQTITKGRVHTEPGQWLKKAVRVCGVLRLNGIQEGFAMNTSIRRVLLLAPLLLAATPHANAQQYAGISTAIVLPVPEVYVIRYGVSLSDHFSAEARIGISAEADLSEFWGDEDALVDYAAAKLNYLVGAYARFGMPLGKNSWYVLLGYTSSDMAMELGNKALRLPLDLTWSGGTFGFGMDRTYGYGWAFNVEYTQYGSKTDLNLPLIALSLGVTKQF